MKGFQSAILFFALAITIPAHSNDFLQGNEKLACEAILCLAASGGTPGECRPSLRKYFSIVIRKNGDFSPRRTLKARKNFLSICPDASNDVVNRVNTSRRDSSYNTPQYRLPGGITFDQLQIFAQLLQAFDIDIQTADADSIREILSHLNLGPGVAESLTDEEVEVIRFWMVLWSRFNPGEP